MPPALRTTPDGQVWTDIKALQERIFGGGEVPETDAWYRRYFGRSLTPETIERVLREAEAGYMRDLTDLESEMIGIDGHLFSVTGKRFPIIASIDYDIVPVDGPGLDPEKALKAAEVVRYGFAGVRNLRQALVDLSWGHYHGRSSLEKQWEYTPGNALLKWRCPQLDWIHPRRLSFGPERELRVVDSMFYTGYFKPVGFDLRSIKHKWITFTPRLRNEYPEREGIGPICLYWGFFKRFSTRDRLILMEVFGKPWRIIEWDAQTRNLPADALDKAQQVADKLGSAASASMPIGAKLKVEQPADGAGEVHGDVVAQANDEMSKIVLGQTRTTEAKPNAIGSSGDETAQQEQDSVLDADGWRLSDVMTEQLALDFVELNLGEEWSVYTPRVIIRTQRPVPRSIRIANAEKTLKLGVPLKLEQVYEETGYERPADGDATIQLVNAGDRDAWGNMTAVTKTVIIDPSKPLPPPPKPPPGAPPASDSGTPADPPATPPLPPDHVTASTTSGEPTAAELLAAKLTDAGVDRCEHGSVNRCRLCGVERVRDFDVDADGKPVRDESGAVVWKVAWKAIDPSLAATISGGDDVLLASIYASVRVAQLQHGDIVCARQPRSENGTPEALIDRGVRDSVRETAQWGKTLVAATDGLKTGGAIFAALNRAAAKLPLTSFARVAERRILHGLMLGALDSLWERETDELVPLEKFSLVRSDVILMAEQLSLPFAEQPFDRAVRLFRERDVLPRGTFEALSGAAKRRAFTIAKLARQDLLDTAHAELARMIEAGKNAMVDGSGPSLGEFRKFCAERLESAGWTPANPSHVETIYRTNVMGAYSDGRRAEMTQPDVLAARPIWQVRGVNDSRTRQPHRDAHGLCLSADDPSWPRAPFGYNCRCRMISRSQRWFKASGKVLSSPPAGLPDDGFDSTEGSLLDLASAE